MNLEDIEKRLSHVEKKVEQLGVNLARSFDNVSRSPANTCTNNGTILEYMLRDLWKRLRGSPKEKQLKELRGIPPRIEQLGGAPPRISRRIYDLMRGIQLTGNRSTHHPKEVVEDDAIDSLRELSQVVRWYFAEFLPSLGWLREVTSLAPVGQRELARRWGAVGARMRLPGARPLVERNRSSWPSSSDYGGMKAKSIRLQVARIGCPAMRRNSVGRSR